MQFNDQLYETYVVRDSTDIKSAIHIYIFLHNWITSFYYRPTALNSLTELVEGSRML